MKKINIKQKSMTNKKLILKLTGVFLILLPFCLFSCNSKNARTVSNDNFSKDFTYVLETIEKNHPNIYSKNNKSEFSLLKQKVLSEGITSKENLIFNLMKLARLVGDSHTRIDLPKELGFSSIVPKFYRYNDSLFLFAVEPNQRDLLGCEVLEINDFPTRKILQAIDQMATYENDSQKLNISQEFVTVPKLLVLLGYGNSEDSLNVKINTKSKTTNYTFKVPNSSFNRTYSKEQTPLWLEKSKNVFYWSEQINEKGDFYLQINSCKEMKDLTFLNFLNTTFAEINKMNHPLNKLILDLRRNNGGDTSVLNPLFTALKSSQIKPKSIIVLISRETFSSAVLNALSLKKIFKAILIGEPTGGALSHFGEQNLVSLPESNLKFWYSTKYFSSNLPLGASLQPDFDVSLNPNDIGNNKDVVLDYALNLK